MPVLCWLLWRRICVPVQEAELCCRSVNGVRDHMKCPCCRRGSDGSVQHGSHISPASDFGSRRVWALGDEMISVFSLPLGTGRKQTIVSCTWAWSEKQCGPSHASQVPSTIQFAHPISRWSCSACSWHYFRMISLVAGFWVFFWVFNIFLTVSCRMSFISTSLFLKDWQPWWIQCGEQMYWKEWFYDH